MNRDAPYVIALVNAVLIEIGFRDPQHHPRWGEAYDSCRKVVEHHVDTAANVAFIKASSKIRKAKDEFLEAYRNVLNILAMGMLISVVLNVVLCAWVFRLVFF